MVKNEQIAHDWVKAFNSANLEALVSLYADDCVHVSPKLKKSKPETLGEIRGKPALREWWGDAFSKLSGIRYELKSVTANEARVFIEYVRSAPNHEDLWVAEVFETRDGKIFASRVYHG